MQETTDSAEYSNKRESLGGSERVYTARSPANLIIGAPEYEKKADGTPDRSKPPIGGGARNTLTTTDAHDKADLLEQVDGVFRTAGGNDWLTILGGKNLTIDTSYYAPPRATGLSSYFSRQPEPPSDNDRVSMFDSYDMQVWTGIGNDRVEFSHSSGRIDTGKGDDTIRMRNLEFNSRLTVNGGEGQDTFITYSAITGRSMGKDGVIHLRMQDGSQVALKNIERIVFEDVGAQQVSALPRPNHTSRPSGATQLS